MPLDASPAGNSATQDKPGAQPTFIANALAGRPALRFDGTEDAFVLPDGFNDFRAGLTAFVVVRPAPGGAWSRFLDLDVGPAHVLAPEEDALGHRHRDEGLVVQVVGAQVALVRVEAGARDEPDILGPLDGVSEDRAADLRRRAVHLVHPCPSREHAPAGMQEA